MRRNLILQEKTGLEQVSDIEIIERMSFGDLDKKKSHEAFAEFHRRYAEGIFSTCSYVCRMLPDSQEAAADLTENVLLRAFTYAASYNPNRASIKTWLNKIAQNEFNDLYAEFRLHHPNDSKDDSDDDIKLDVEDDTPIDRAIINGEKLEIALNTLNAMERDILMTHMMHKDIDNTDSQIPTSVMDDLCKLYQKKPFTIRKIKSRAISKIKTFILKQ